MRPFNLAEALAGKPVVNRTGEKVTVTRLAKTTILGYDLVGQGEDGRILGYLNLDGCNQYNIEFDLFMAPTTVTRWVNLYQIADGMQTLSYFYATEDIANAGAAGRRIGNKAHKITYEE